MESMRMVTHERFTLLLFLEDAKKESTRASWLCKEKILVPGVLEKVCIEICRRKGKEKKRRGIRD